MLAGWQPVVLRSDVPELFYFRHPLSTLYSSYATQPTALVYVVPAGAYRPRPGVVAALGAFPPQWRPTSSPGQVLFNAAHVEPAVLECEVPRNSFRHYTRITEAEAFVRFPELIFAVRGQQESG